MDIIISNADSRPIYEQITAQVKGLILAGRLSPGDALRAVTLTPKGARVLRERLGIRLTDIDDG